MLGFSNPDLTPTVGERLGQRTEREQPTDFIIQQGQRICKHKPDGTTPQ
jgi:hypothetical protein